MYGKHILRKKASEAHGLLQLSLRLARMERWHAVEAALDCVWNIFSVSPSPHLFKRETIRPMLRKNGARLRELMEKIPERGLRELQCIRDLHFPDALQGRLYSELWARLSIFLDDNDPAALPEDDNLLLDTVIPLQSFEPGDRDFAERALEFAWPRPDARLLSAAESVWLDLNASYCLGVKLSRSDPPVLMTEDELARLLSWRQRAADLFAEPGGDTELRIEPEYRSASGVDLLRILLARVNDLAAAVDYEMPSSYASYLEDFATCLDNVPKRIHRLAHLSDRTEIRKESDHDPGPGNKAYPQGRSGRENILRLDQAMRLLEPAAQSVIREAGEMVCAEIGSDPALLPENNRPDIVNLTLWTKSNGDLARRFTALPLISVKYPGTGLICDGDNWSETREIEHMVYLTHIIAHDTFVPWSDTGLTDYVTLRIDCTRQAYGSLKEA